MMHLFTDIPQDGEWRNRPRQKGKRFIWVTKWYNLHVQYFQAIAQPGRLHHMAKPTQTVIQHLNRAKAAFLKGETLRPMVSVAEALKIVITQDIHSQDMSRIGPLLRENLQNISKMEQVRRHTQEAFAYKPGEEKQILARLVPLVKAIHGERKREDMDAVRARKLRIDHAIIHGANAVQAGKVEEAKKYFREAVNLHVDEDAMFMIIADKLQSAGAYKESFEYLRQALMVNPGDRRACEMTVAATVQVGNIQRGQTLLRKVADKKGMTAHLSYALAQLAAKQKQWADAEELAAAALEMDDSLVEARKFHRKVATKAAKAAKAGG